MGEKPGWWRRVVSDQDSSGQGYLTNGITGACDYLHADAPNMTTQNGRSNEQDRGGATENQKCPASRLEKVCGSGRDIFFYWCAVVVCRNFPREKQRIGDLWRLTHRHDNVLQRTSTPWAAGDRQRRRHPSAMTQINW
jgi:hypothetical protein